MAGAIKGITIEFNGDTTKLDKALRTIRKDSKGVDSDLRAVNRALKFNPTSTELLRQKFTLLGQKVDATEKELKQFRDIEKQLKAQGVSKTSSEFMRVRRNIVEAESKLKTFKGQLASVRFANLSALGAKMKQIGAGFRTAGMYATIGGAAMVAAGKKLLELNSTQEGAERKLIEIYKTRMGVDKKAAKSTMAVASAMQKQGVIGDEVTLSGAQQLATYAKYPGTVDKLLPAMGNLLVQQKGVNATAEDATSIANLFGKAMMGQTGALKKVGISFDESQEKVLKYGTEEEKAAVLAEVVTQNVGNMNKVFANTDEGKMAQLRNTLGDIGERIGHALLPALGQLANYISANIVPKIEKIVAFMEGHPVIAKILVGITTLLTVGGPLLILLGGIITAVGTILGSIGSLITFIPMLAGPIGIVIAAVTAAIAIGVLLYKNWDTVKAKLTAAWNKIKTTATSAFTKIKTTITTAMTNAKTKALSIVNGIKTGFTSKIDALKKSVGTAFESIKSKITKPISDAKATLSGVVKKITGLFPISLGKILHFSIPKISVTGGKAPWGLGGKGKKPNFSVSWAQHAAGGIFKRPTLLQDFGGGNHLVGEGSSPEAILPLNTLWAQMDRMADSIVNGVMMSQQIAGAGAGAPMQINLYAFPNGPQMGSWVVNTYDKYKKQLG